jgi:glycosyltransferase involved in cell wall biosynthesis
MTNTADIRAPRVSVILPTYNRAAVVPRAIKSVLTQSYPDFELIVVDDQSTDETENVVRAIKDSRVRYIRCTHNGGPAFARNRGIEAAHGDLIAFQDSDDEWLPGKLASQVAMMDSLPAGVGMLCGAYQARFPDGRTTMVSMDDSMLRGEFERALLSGFGFITPTWLVRRNCMVESGMFNEQLPNREDWELMFRLYPRWEIRALAQLLVAKHVMAGSVEGNWRGRVASFGLVLEQHGSRWRNSPWLLAQHHHDQALLHIELGDAGEARRSLRTALQLRPLWSRAWMKYVLLLGGVRLYQLLRKIVRSPAAESA